MRKLLLDGQYRRGIIESLDHAKGDAGKHDRDHAIDMHDDAADQQMGDLAVTAPHRDAEQDHQDAKEDLCNLSPEQRSQSAARLVRTRISEELQVQRVLLFKAPVEGLPGGFHVVKFHRRIHV